MRQSLIHRIKRPFLLVGILSSPVFSLPPNFQETTVASGLSQPTSMAFAPDGRLFVLEKAGAVRIVSNGSLAAVPFLTLSVNTASERGLLGIAFDPDFASNRLIYLYYTASSPIVNRVSRFTASLANPNVVQTGSEQVLLDNIPSTAGNHNGGALHFGPDGKLYIAIGDSANSSNAPLLTTVAGKILRINSDGSIPADNPFVATSGARGEIWAYGLRNPFTFAFDAVGGAMHINDVGQGTWEEINPGVRGANYGWPTCEGPQTTGVGTCTSTAFTYPVHSYAHPLGFAVTGGVFYRGSQFPSSFSGSYLFADYIGRFITQLTPSRQTAEFAAPGSVDSPVDLDIAPDGSLYYLAINSGRVQRIQFTAAVSRCDVNADGSTNVSDVQLSVNQALGAASCGSGDINQDGQCTVVDVQRIVNAALGGACVSP
jgi:glucose/arabinose dehydrogenase